MKSSSSSSSSSPEPERTSKYGSERHENKKSEKPKRKPRSAPERSEKSAKEAKLKSVVKVTSSSPRKVSTKTETKECKLVTETVSQNARATSPRTIEDLLETVGDRKTSRTHPTSSLSDRLGPQRFFNTVNTILQCGRSTTRTLETICIVPITLQREMRKASTLRGSLCED